MSRKDGEELPLNLRLKLKPDLVIVKSLEISPKLLYAVLNNIPVVSIDWVRISMRGCRVIPPHSHLLLTRNYLEEDYTIFSDYSFVVSSLLMDECRLKQIDIKGMILRLGGKIFNSVNSTREEEKRLVIYLTSRNDGKKFVGTYRRDREIVRLQGDWVYHCLMSKSLVDYNKFLL